MDAVSFEDFYKDAMDFFIQAGHAVSSNPVYFNHSSKQVIYFDTKKILLIDNTQIHDLKYATSISHLFDIGDDVFAAQTEEKVSYYSIVIECEKKNRSQTAYETHMLLHPAFEENSSIVLFRHNDSLMMSILRSGSELILSDWYNADTDCDSFIERLHISNLSLSSVSEFVSDLSYNIARSYYFQLEIDSNSMYNLLPVKFFVETDITTIDKESIRETIHEILAAPKKAYGDDYIEPESHSFEAKSDIDVELDLLSFELEFEKEAIPDEILNDDEQDDDSGNIEREENASMDKYEFSDVDPEVFKDASQMLKWLKKHDAIV